MDHKDSQKGNSEKSCFEKDCEKSYVKPECEETTTSRQDSVAVEVEDILEYHDSYRKQQKLAIKKWKKEAKKLDNKKKSNVFYQQNFFIYAVSDDAEAFEYDDPETRNKFVAKVFLIVAGLLMGNTICAAIVRYIPGMRWFLEDQVIPVIVICCIALFILVVIHVGICYFAYMSKPPCTWVNLVLAFMCYNVLLSLTTLVFHSLLILFAMGSVGVVVFICFLIALSKIDFTKKLTLALIMVVTGVVGVMAGGALKGFGVEIPYWQMGALTFLIIATSFVLVIQMQMLLGGKSVEFGENDLAMPALMIYTSIITLLLQILRLLRETGLFGDSDFFSNDD